MLVNVRMFRSLALALVVGLVVIPVAAQPLTVMPVSIQLAPGQKVTTLTVINEGDRPTSFQVRAYNWRQSETGEAQLIDSSDLVASPPLATVAPKSRQVVRLVLRKSPSEREVSYRILLDQIPGPSTPGTVQIALRLSIPVFAPPEVRVAPRVTWRIENSGGQAWLVAANEGTSHIKVQEMTLRSGGGSLAVESISQSPYVLEGSIRRWRLQGRIPPGSLRLVGKADTGLLDAAIQ